MTETVTPRTAATSLNHAAHAAPAVDPAADHTADPAAEQQRSAVRRPALSPSRASDFKQCPLLYRLRVVDKIPEKSTKVQVRGTLVHAVLEKLFGLPQSERLPEQAKELLAPTWEELAQSRPEWTELFPEQDPAEVTEWLSSAASLVDNYFSLEDPRRLTPQACELKVETELESGVLLRGYVDRLDVAPTGEMRVVDYKTGAAPREIGEAKALFQMKFYAVALWRLRGMVPRQLKLMYLADGQALAYTPTEAELVRFQRTLEAIWRAIRQAGETGDFRPNPSKLCGWCDFQAYCPAFGGSPPEYPGWPEPETEPKGPLDEVD